MMKKLSSTRILLAASILRFFRTNTKLKARMTCGFVTLRFKMPTANLENI
jgi:hypothetical protein